MQNENVQNEIVNTRPSRGFFRRLSRKTRLSILFFALLAAGALSAVGLNQVMPKPPTRAQGFLDRLVWYVNQGQMHTDMHTLASTVEYILASETEPLTATVPPNQRLTQNAPPTSPKS